MDRLKGQLLKSADQKAPGLSLQRGGKTLGVRWISVLILEKYLYCTTGNLCSGAIAANSSAL